MPYSTRGGTFCTVVSDAEMEARALNYKVIGDDLVLDINDAERIRTLKADSWDRSVIYSPARVDYVYDLLRIFIDIWVLLDPLKTIPQRIPQMMTMIPLMTMRMILWMTMMIPLRRNE